MKLGKAIARFFTLSAVISISGTAFAVDSIWSSEVAKILPTDETVSCYYTTSTTAGVFSAAARFQKRSTDGMLMTDAYTDATTKLQLKMQCLNMATGVITSPASATSVGFTNSATVSCPAGLVGIYIRCMIRSTDTNPFVYGSGSGQGDPCGDGVSAITRPPSPATNVYRGQVTGQLGGFLETPSEMNFRVAAGDKVFNSSVMTTAQVYGTDMGYMFYSGGYLWSGFGDTWAERTWNPNLSPTYKRGSILFKTQDLDPSDSNGLTFSSWEGSPSFAKEIVPCCHNSLGCDEQSAIATAGFGLKEGASTFRILWFDAISSWWPSFASKVATLAWSVNGAAFSRADKTPPPGLTPPQWSNTSHFGAGTVWHDRMHGYVYFFGQRPYLANTPVRLARVPAKFASVMDRTKYEYWSGLAWVKDALNPMGPSETGYFPNGSLADIIPGSINPGPEFSVAFDAYANRYIMLIVSNRWTNSAATQLWQSSSITGPWTRVTAGANNLPSATMAGGTWYPYNFFYGPYMSEHLMRNGGQSVYYQLSEWNGLPYTKPYNTGLWSFNITRNQKTSCAP